VKKKTPKKKGLVAGDRSRRVAATEGWDLLKGGGGILGHGRPVAGAWSDKRKGGGKTLFLVTVTVAGHRSRPRDSVKKRKIP